MVVLDLPGDKDPMTAHPAQADSSRPASARTDAPLRWVAAAGTAVSALVHGYLYLDGWSSVPVTGPLFLVNAVAGLIIAVALVVSAHPLWRLLAVGFNASSLAALLVSHTEMGFFGTREMFWDAWQLAALGSEAVALVAASWALIVWWRRRGA